MKLPHWSYFFWPVLAPFAWWQYQTVVLPATSHHWLLHLIFIFSFALKWIFWFRLQLIDPGEYVVPYGPPGTTLGVGAIGTSWGWRRGGFPDFTRRSQNAASTQNYKDANQNNPEEATSFVPSSDTRASKVNPNFAINSWAAKHRALYDRVLDEGLQVPVCLTCEIVKPVRAKHDRISDVCVAKFDHFCPWMNACIGELNYRDFFITMISATVCIWCWLILVVYYTAELDLTKSWFHNFSTIWVWELFAWFFLLFALYASAMSGQHIMLVAKNLSTNEMINGFRYRYLAEDGTRGNPFNRGIIMNYAELFGLVAPMKYDPEQYYSEEFAGRPTPPIRLPPKGSPWFRKMEIPGEGFNDDGHFHGHSHNGDSHGHSH